MPTPPGRRAATRAAGLVLIGSAGIQTSSALSATLFDSLGSAPVSALRMAMAAVVLLAAFRPRLGGRTRPQWTGIVVYGAAMALMNLSLYAAIERIPLGVAVTLDFLGPCVVALLGSRRVREGLGALVALGGVALISAGPGGYFDLAGYLFGLGAGAAFAVYTICADTVGKSDAGLGDLALSVTVAAVVTLPVSLTHAAAVTSPQWGVLAVSAVVGVVVPYTVDTVAGRITSARVIGTLFAIDPAMGALLGWLLLGEALTPSATTGIVLVSAAGALVVWAAGRSDERDPAARVPGPPPHVGTHDS
ncbi:EamA family transporter [Xylanimonas allomyrinae]|uniref:EamA family transporter n=1 Tax=Xylanimonas allomyrinae TaxID=2509459 RepID=A0A4P6ERJ5_9MICO|nr:EamA family transporter [Xylanimonas allomyrinae]QAY62997.1 EamA family transporter [Xylanimonas allomyrinae]